MNTNSRFKNPYRGFTIPFVVLMLASGIGYTVGARPVVEGMAHLGYPHYLIRFLGVAKLLGAVAILYGRFPGIKEWAYAGFFFDLLGALYSHLNSDDGLKFLIPLVVLFIEIMSYVFWKRLQAAPSAEIPGFKAMSGNRI